VLLLGAEVTALAVPMGEEDSDFAGQLPDVVHDARAGRSPNGDFLEQANALPPSAATADPSSDALGQRPEPRIGAMGGDASGYLSW
jgi:hypothetical protein